MNSPDELLEYNEARIEYFSAIMMRPISADPSRITAANAYVTIFHTNAVEALFCEIRATKHKAIQERGS